MRIFATGLLIVLTSLLSIQIAEARVAVTVVASPEWVDEPYGYGYYGPGPYYYDGPEFAFYGYDGGGHHWHHSHGGYHGGGHHH